jgi:hypothetical protein
LLVVALEVHLVLQQLVVLETLDQMAVILYLAPLRQMVVEVVADIRLVVPLKLPELAEHLEVVERV